MSSNTSRCIPTAPKMVQDRVQHEHIERQLRLDAGSRDPKTWTTGSRWRRRITLTETRSSADHPPLEQDGRRTRARAGQEHRQRPYPGSWTAAAPNSIGEARHHAVSGSRMRRRDGWMNRDCRYRSPLRETAGSCRSGAAARRHSRRLWRLPSRSCAEMRQASRRDRQPARRPRAG